MAEAQYMKMLGPSVCPEVYGVLGDTGLVMQYLEDYAPEHQPRKLVNARFMLENRVWDRWDASVVDNEWGVKFTRRFCFTAPSWVEGRHHLIHGDPTAANIRCGDDDEIRILDPKRPGNGIPAFWQVDMGKMIQSMMGWETALAHCEEIDYDSPLTELNELDLRLSVFWASVHFMRIAQREQPNGRLLSWSQLCARKLMELVW